MILERIVEDGLSQFSYIVGDEETGEVVVVDPLRDVDQYAEWVDEQGLELVAVLETHIHADYASGALELADLMGIPYYASAHDKDEKYEMSFDHRSLADGDTVEVGGLSFEAVHTPGHTPEHLSYLLKTDGTPRRLFSGDFLFVHSLGRPDLIGGGTSESLARKLYESVGKVKERDWPDNLKIHPAHGAGSLCGSGLSENPESTLGEEHDHNPYFQIDDEDEFVDRILDALGDFPPYYKRMKETNSEGAPFLQPIGHPPTVAEDDFVGTYESDQNVTVIDLRDQASFGKSHVPGSLNLPYAARINRYAPWVVPYDQPIFVIGTASMGDEVMEQVYRYFVRVELDAVEGYLEGGYETWQSGGHPTEEVAQYDAPYLREQLPSNEWTVIDVRTEDEYRSGHLPGARWIPFGRIRDRTDELPEDWEQPIVTVCSSGYRSSLSASLLKSMGYRNLGHLAGGFPSWADQGYEFKRGAKSEESTATILDDDQ